MSLLDTIKQTSVQVRKERDKLASFFTTLYSEAAMVGKTDGNRESTDTETIKVIRKFLKNLEEVIVVYKARGEDAIEQLNNALAEKAALEKYLPTNITEEDVQLLINRAIQEGHDTTGKIISFIKTQVDVATVNMKAAGAYIHEQLNK